MDVLHRFGQDHQTVGENFFLHRVICVLGHMHAYSGMAQRQCHRSSVRAFGHRSSQSGMLLQGVRIGTTCLLSPPARV